MVEVLRGFKQRILQSNELIWLFVALVVSVTAITSVTFLADRLNQSFQQNAHDLIGADVIVRGDQELDRYFESTAKNLDLAVAHTVIFSTMMRTGVQSKLVSLKAVSHQYPLRGKMTLAQEGRGLLPGEIWLEPQLARNLKIQIGDQVLLGEKSFLVSNLIIKEPDRGATFMNFAPRAMISEEDLEATGLIGIGSRVTYRLLVAGQDQKNVARDLKNVDEFSTLAKAYIASKNLRGVRLEGLDNGQPLLRKTIDQASRFLSLVAILTGMISAVGIGLASRRYVKKQVITAAVWRCFGASGAQSLQKHVRYCLQIMLGASAVGVALGYGLQEVLIRVMQGLLDQQLPSPSFLPILWGFLVAFILLFGFSIPSLLALLKVSPMVVLRKENITLQFNEWIAALLGIGSYFVLLVWIAHNIRLSLIVLASFVGACFIFVACAYLIVKYIGKKVARPGYTLPGIRFSAQRIVGNPSWMSFQITSLGIAMLAILLLVVIRVDVLNAWQGSVPRSANNRFILNVLPDQKDAVEEQLRYQLHYPDFDSYPMIRGRLIAINHHDLQSQDFEDENTKRLVEREFNLSYSSSLPSKNRIIAGSWMTPGNPNQVSMEAGIMKSLHTQLGDVLTFDVAGHLYEVQITSVRKLDWNSMRVNFFAMMPIDLLKDAPQSWIMAFRQDETQRLDMDIVDRFPNITAINIQDSLTQVQDILGKLIFAIQILFIFTLLAGLIVLMIALVTVQEQRMKEVAVLKTLGADRVFLMKVWLFELILSGSIAGFLSGGFASFTGWYLANYLLEIEMDFTWWIFGLGFLMGIILNSLASLWLRRKTFEASPLMILQT